MSENILFPIILFTIILVFIMIYFLVKKYIKYKKIRTGKNGEKKVSRALHKIAKKGGYQVIDDLYLPLYDKTTQIDHVVIGEFGIAVIETKALNSEIYGNESDKNWVHISGNNKNKFYNPLLQNKTHIDCIRHILIKQNIHKVQIDSIVVFSEKNAILNIPKGLPVITLSLLKKYFRKSRYNKDNDIDIQLIYDTLMNHRVTDKELIKKHNKNVKKMTHGKY